MGMEGLGRVYNVVPIASGVAINAQIGASLSFVCTGNDTFTLTVATAFAASYVAPPTTAIGGGLIRNYYTNTSTGGTAAWVNTKLVSGSYVNAVTIASGAVAFTVYGADMTPTTSAGTAYQYIKCAGTGVGLVTAIIVDLVHQRTPANMTIVSA